jgi:pimeloyl-ACP methyl ester carboxylesterase
MKIIMKISKFKTDAARKFTEDWIDSFASESALRYEKLDVDTSFGRTRLLAAGHEKKHLKPLLFVPGARTCGIFWDANNHLHLLGDKYRIYLLDVIGQPSLSDGNCPKVKDESYGVWLDEVCEKINFEKGVFIGASFGGLLIFKLAAVAPERIEKAVLMNPVGLSYISLRPRSLYYTLAPVFFPNRKNVERFLDKIIFTETETPDADKLKRIADYIETSVKDFEFGGEYPYKLGDDEVVKLRAETHLLVGDKDGLIPYLNTVRRAKELLPNLKSVEVFPEIGHGIELSTKPILKLAEILAH